jgi:phosphoribosylanthranilate isomerase
MIIKICGITTLEDALASARAGADMLGFNFFKRSPRYIEPDAAARLCNDLRDELGDATPILVGVFVNEVVGRISMTLEKVGLRYAQLSGDESVDMLKELRGIGFKAIRPRNKVEALDDAAYFLPSASADAHVPSLLLDANLPGQYGGTGQQASEEVALAVKESVPRLMLAGGLNPVNVGAIVRAVQPWGVDVASGVEGDTPGRKDAHLVKTFIQAARGAG